MYSLVVGAQDVSDTALGVDQFAGCTFDCQLATQVGDIRFDDRNFSTPVVFPHVIQDLHFRHDASLVDHQVAKKLELCGGQVNFDARTADLVRILVNDQVADAELAIVFFGADGASQDGADTGNDLFKAEGLGYVVVATDGQTLDLVTHIVACGQE